MDLTNKVSLITGGARIGREVAIRLAELGSDLVLTYRTSRPAAEDVRAIAESLGRKAFLIHSDLRAGKSATHVIARIQKEFGRLDVLIHMASVYGKTPFEKLNRSIWKENLDIHLNSTYELALGAARLMRKNGVGRIIHFSDWTSASERPRYKGFLPYYVSKAAVLGLTQTLALELAPRILVNSIAPGPILPPKGFGKAELDEVIQATPLKRWGTAAEIVKAVEFLIKTDFVTGECIRVDGGRHLY